jgi:hypothetical protein
VRILYRSIRTVFQGRPQAHDLSLKFLSGQMLQYFT